MGGEETIAVIVGDREPLASFGAGLAEDLAGLGYTPNCIVRHVRLLRRLDEWMAGEGLTPGELTGGDVERFVGTRRAAGQLRWPSQRGVAPLLAYLRGAGVVPMPPAPVAASGSVERVVASYQRWLVEERSLAASTVEDYERYARRFFSQLAEPVREDLSRLSAADVTAAVRSQCRSRSVGWAKNFNTVLRSLLRFLFLEGYVARDLSPSVLSVAGWRHSGLPKALDPKDVAKLLASCARQRRAGRRDLAILTVVVRLGLRAGEVAALELGDIDWRAGEIVVRGKGGRLDRLPLPGDVGEVIVDYLRHERPPTTSRHVFILAVAPRTGISTKTVGGVVRCACERAGLAPFGPHRLRHTAATEMLRGGASLAEVGQVLRHQHQETTSIYAKVDLGSLAMLAMPWPQVSA
jgi:site-specific recombinase XerD